MRKTVAYKANWFPPTFNVGCGCIAIQFVLYDTFERVCDNYGVEASMVMQWTVNPPAYATPGSIPGYSTTYAPFV